MNKRSWSACILSGMALAIMGSMAHAADLLDTVKARGELICGVELQSPPLEFSEGGKAKGYSVDLLAQVAANMGIKIRYVDVPFPSLLPGLDVAKYDMSCASVTATKARMVRYRYSLPLAEGSVGLVKRANDASIQASEDISGKVVGAGKGSSMLKLLQEYAATLPEGPKEIREYIDANQAYADLSNGRLSAVAQPLPNILYLAQTRPDTFAVVLPAFGPKAYLGWMMRNDEESASLMDAINVELVKLNKNGKIAELQKKWLGTEIPLPSEMPDPVY